jgi:two-component system, NarL family, invasion response regulator UvrY
MKILIVDDHAVIHQGLKRILDDEFEGATFGEARHSQEALDLMSRERWDLVILDVDLPGRGGLDVLKQVRAEHPKLPVLIFSMHSEEQFAVRALKAGASGYVAKDGDSERLVEAIHKVIRGGRYVSAALAEKLAADLSRHMSPVSHEILSDREFEVMRMIAEGKTTTAIADLLSLSVKTVSTYRTRILEKLQLETTSELIRYAIDHGLDR